MVRAVIRSFKHEPNVQKFRFLWIKYVTAVNLDEHCQKCLIGPRSKLLGTRIIAGATKPVIKTDIVLSEAAAEFIYICGVAEPYNWNRNFHMALRVQEGKSCSKIWPGLELSIDSAVELQITDEHMDKAFHRYPDKWYRTCRNAHFAWGFHRGAYGNSAPGQPNGSPPKRT